MMELPIEDVLPELRGVLAERTCAVLQAPPGAGKTTRVPLALLAEPWLAGGRIVMLEPRRIAARAAAARMAATLYERVGETVGYRMRLDTKVGPATRIEVVTEGVLARMLQADPALDGVGLVIFDEFHERSLNADLGLALALESQRALRDDLRLIVMSATLDGAAVASLLGGAPIVTSVGRAFPVATHYAERAVDERPEHAVASAVRMALARGEGDVLAFLPGTAEIRRAATLLESGPLPAGVRVAVLHGMLGAEEQDRALAPSRPGERKVVLATSIAETSVTIEGIRVVIDSGWARVPRFSPRSGMTRLETIRVARASADQRRGRAGRTGPGVCYRLWTAADHEALLERNQPEILEADLAPLALELAEWGVRDPDRLAWLDAPPSAAYAQARELLAELGALDHGGAVTPHGKRMAALPAHPRLAHMMLIARDLGLGGTACAIAALVGDRDIFRSSGAPIDVDLRLRLAALRAFDRRDGDESGHAPSGGLLDRAACARAVAAAREWRRRLGIREAQEDIEACGLLLAFAYPDRIAQRRSGAAGRFLLRNGAAAVVAESQPLAGSPYLVVADIDGQRAAGRVFLAAPIDEEEIVRHFGDQIVHEESVAFEEGAVRARRRERLGAIVMRERPLADASPDAIADALIDAVRGAGGALLPWRPEARRVQARMIFLRRLDDAVPDVTDAALAATLDAWLRPRVMGMRRKEDMAALDLGGILLDMLAWDLRARMDADAPTHLVVPSGSRVPIDYTNPEAPTVSVRLQEMFGCTETPRIGRGGVPITMHLLSPAGRPVQVTRDLANFWRATYFEVRKDLKGRYPKHYWPDDPLQAVPTNRVRPRP